MAAYGALHGVPLLVESDPGQGKTSLALAIGQAFGLSVLRVQFYEGLTADKILYDYNYQRQLLSIQTIQSTLAKNLDGKTINEAMASCLYQLQSLCLKQIPSISEGITWAGYLQKLMDDKDFNIADSLCMLCKNKEDQIRVRDAGILPNVKELS